MSIRQHLPIPLLAIGLLAVAGCAPSRPGVSESVPTPHPAKASGEPTKPVASPVGPIAEPAPATPPASTVDSTGTPPRPTVLIPSQNGFAVRTKLVPRVMGSGWGLMVNRPDSLEFYRAADSALTTYLFGLAPAPNTRLRLRFILTPEGDGTRIALMGHLVGKDGPLPYVAREAPLVENLTALQADLLAAPPMQPPEKQGKKKKK